MDFWKRLQNWYTKKGISTEQFFAGNSTEIGRDEMLMDFAQRMLNQEFPEPSPLAKEIYECADCDKADVWCDKHTKAVVKASKNGSSI